MLNTQPEPKTCDYCGKLYAPQRPLQTVCGPRCAIANGRIAKKLERALVKQQKEEDKNLPQLKKEAQAVFNKFIRARDQFQGHACISSGRPLDWTGNRVDAGHYRSIGAAPHLRYNPDNCHAQSKRDNRWLSGNAVDYRLGLIARIGLKRVKALENNNRVEKWSHEDLLDIKADCKIKLGVMLKALKAAIR